MAKNTHRPPLSGFHLFNLLGFKVSIDFSWIFLAILIVWSLAAGYFPLSFPGLSQTTYWMMGLIGAIGLFLSIILHELCHSLVGRYFGVAFTGITLFIFGGIAEMQDTPPNPKTELLMSLAGPLFSIIFGILFNILFYIGTNADWPTSINGILNYLAFINIFVGIFNLLPGFPLDGGRILRSILWWWKKDLTWATQIAYRCGVGFGFAMIFFGIFLFIQKAFIGGFWMFLLGFYLQIIAKKSYEDMLIREVFKHEHIKKYAKTNPIAISPNMTLATVVNEYFYHYYHKLYPVVEKGKLVGYLSFNDIKTIEKETWSTRLVADVMHALTPHVVVDAETEVTYALQLMLSDRIGRLLVVDHGKLYGIVSLKDLRDVIFMKLHFKPE